VALAVIFLGKKNGRFDLALSMPLQSKLDRTLGFLFQLTNNNSDYFLSRNYKFRRKNQKGTLQEL
jgi:hypothetical protein